MSDVRARSGGVLTAPPTSRARLWLAGSLLALYGLVVAGATLGPTPIDEGYDGVIAKVLKVLHRMGVPEWFGYAEVEFLANVALYVPLGLLVGLVLGRYLWLGVVIIPALSGAVEGAQAQFLAERYATLQDVVANTVGGWIGLLLAAIVIGLVHARDRRVVAAAMTADAQGGQAGQDRVRVTLALVVLAVCAAVVLAVTLRPTAVTVGNDAAIDTVLKATRQAGAPDSFDYHALEFAANILMFIPVGFFAALVCRRGRMWVALLVVPMLSGAVELVQAVLLPGRTGAWSDVVANSMGAWIGIFAAMIVRALVHARDENVIARARFAAEHDGA